MPTNYTVSSDVDTLLKKSSKEEVATFLGVADTKAQWGQITGTLSTQTDLQSALNAKASASDVSANTSNISTNTTNIATNTTNISANATNISSISSQVDINTSAISDKANTASPTFTGTVVLPKISNDIDFVNGNIELLVDSGVTGKGNIQLSGGGDVDLQGGKLKAGNVEIDSQDGSINFGTGTPSLVGKIKGETKFENSTSFEASTEFSEEVTFNKGLDSLNDITLNSSSKLFTNAIHCVGTTHATTEPINYTAKEHRFKDFDGDPDDLFVIKKIDNYTGARVAINQNPRSDMNAALHIVAGEDQFGEKDYALMVIGGAFFDDYVKVGNYTDTERDDLRPRNGSIIYNSEHHEFQGYLGGTSAGWVKFNTGAVST